MGSAFLMVPCLRVEHDYEPIPVYHGHYFNNLHECHTECRPQSVRLLLRMRVRVRLSVQVGVKGKWSGYGKRPSVKIKDNTLVLTYITECCNGTKLNVLVTVYMYMAITNHCMTADDPFFFSRARLRFMRALIRGGIGELGMCSFTWCYVHWHLWILPRSIGYSRERSSVVYFIIVSNGHWWRPIRGHVMGIG